MSWTRDQKLAAAGVGLAAVAAVVAITTPEVRRWLRLDKTPSATWSYDDDGDGHSGITWAMVTSVQPPAEPPPGCKTCYGANWKITLPVDDCDDADPRIFPGADCTTGVGACRQSAQYACTPSGSVCQAHAVAPQGFHDSTAPNGSWDWDCNGVVAREWRACEELTQEQCDPNTNATRKANGGFCANLRAPDGCPPTVGECGQHIYTYPCFWNPSDGRCHAGGYETATIMACR